MLSYSSKSIFKTGIYELFIARIHFFNLWVESTNVRDVIPEELLFEILKFGSKLLLLAMWSWLGLVKCSKNKLWVRTSKRISCQFS